MIQRSDLFQILSDRGYIYQSTNLEEVKQKLTGEPITFYLGIDPTADSLHIGHFFALMMFRYLQDAGHQGVLLIGGATAMVGDPTARTDLRKMLTKEQVDHNLEEVKTLAKRFIKTDGDNPAIIVNNADWFSGYDYVSFMRDIGVHFNVNKMLSADAYVNRLEAGGLTFLEMGYMLMQAYDFVYLNKKYSCILQIGGSDQWGNITAGTTLHRKLNLVEEDKTFAGDIFGITCPLLVNKDGKKMGKTSGGALWVAREKTTVYDFYQYFYNVADEDVGMLLKLFTRVELDKIEELLKADIIAAKQLMAFEITKLVHGQEEAEAVVEAAKALFAGSGDLSNVPTFQLNLAGAKEITILDLATQSGFISSKGEVRRIIDQGGLSIGDQKITDSTMIVKFADYPEGYLVLKRGKKQFLKVIFN